MGQGHFSYPLIIENMNRCVLGWLREFSDLKKNQKTFFAVLNNIPRKFMKDYFHHVIKVGNYFYVSLKPEKQQKENAIALFEPSFWNCL